MLVVGANAYVSLPDADAYFAARANPTWAAATDAAKEAGIVKATAYMDASYVWKGVIASDTQALGWPRLNVWDAQGRNVANIIPQGVKDACCELALLSFDGDLVSMQVGVGRVTSERVGQVAVTYEGGADSQGYMYANLLLRGLGSLRGGAQVIKLDREQMWNRTGMKPWI
jgi:hypothetical protein